MDLNAFIAVARSKGTSIIDLQDEPCKKCGCIHYYARTGRKHGDCVSCKVNHNKARDNSCAQPNQQHLTSISEIDENGVKVYTGKSCSRCGNNIRLNENAYSAKRGKCIDCAIAEYEEKRYSREIKRTETTVKQKVNNFIVQSVNQSETIQVAPNNQYEYFAIRDLMWKCEVINQQEKALNTGIRWEMGHMFPASGSGTYYRGKATTDNLFLIQWEQNRKDGDKLPEQWTQKQVISFDECQAVMSLSDAAVKWRALSGFDKMTPQERKERTVREREAQEAYKQRVREITQSALDRLPVLEYPNLFNEACENIQTDWNKIVLRMSKQVDSFIQTSETMKWADVREQKLTIDAFQGATARTWIVKQTLEQIADTETKLQDDGITEEQQQMLDTVKRCAVMWARDVLRTEKNLIMGFTHPLIDVISDAKAWGTYQDESTAKQWLCVWNGKPPADEQEKPFYDESDSIRKFNIKNAWKEGDEQYIYLTLKEQQLQHQKEQAKVERLQAIEQRKKDELAATNKRFDYLITLLDTDLSHLEEHARTLPPIIRYDAVKHVENQLPIIDKMRDELLAIRERGGENAATYRNDLDMWEAHTRCKMNHILNPDILFYDFIKPY